MVVEVEVVRSETRPVAEAIEFGQASARGRRALHVMMLQPAHRYVLHSHRVSLPSHPHLATSAQGLAVHLDRLVLTGRGPAVCEKHMHSIR